MLLVKRFLAKYSTVCKGKTDHQDIKGLALCCALLYFLRFFLLLDHLQKETVSEYKLSVVGPDIAQNMPLLQNFYNEMCFKFTQIHINVEFTYLRLLHFSAPPLQFMEVS
jgi:hypothetical protein